MQWFLTYDKSIVQTVFYIRNTEKFNMHMLVYFFKNKIRRKNAEMNEIDNL